VGPSLVKISVLTVCLNEASTIERCIESVLAQDYPDIEYVVIDGKSSDGTTDALNFFSSSIDQLVIERDSGIYSAMNKGVRLCQGEWIYFLNANDYFYSSEVISQAVSIMGENPKASIISGKVQFINTPCIDGKPYDRDDFSYGSKVELYRKPIPQQCLFVRRNLFGLYGMFDERYRICADYDWLLRVMSGGESIEFSELCFSFFDYTGVSCTEKQLRKREKNWIILRNSSAIELIRFVVGGIFQRICGAFK